jgi:predicted transcriptional regulator/5'-deoxynucleotidase YfbR-like HD superfamily hydrolase
MESNDPGRVCQLLEALAGEPSPLQEHPCSCPSFPKNGLGYSQLNELLLLHGYDRVTHAFFQFLADGGFDYKIGSSIRSMEDFEAAVLRARKLSLLFFGNVKFGFKKLARDAEEFSYYYSSTQPLDEDIFKRRHEAIRPLEHIPSEKTYYLGYVVQQELSKKLQDNPDDQTALAAMEELKGVRSKGIRNQHAYLISDHLDVYIATSMRRRHEYLEVGEFAKRVFDSDQLKNLRLRWFDPTQAYCADRIDKGLSEALMLRRATCTLYLVQESDTLGKDSELASTLAQGKTVIAYLPSPTEQEVADDVNRLSKLYDRTKTSIIVERLRDMSPTLAWHDANIRRWLDDPEKVELETAMQLLVKTTRKHYDSRATTLRESHPLGIQVNLDTGVANGVLVVRTIKDCAELIRRIVTHRLEFRIEENTIEGVKYQLLRETVSDSVFRVMTGDAILTNSFWNFYLEPSE